MAVERDIRYELLARLCPNATGADISSVCTEVRRRKLDPNLKASSFKFLL